MIKELFRGLKHNRYTESPLEYAFALEWQKYNDTNQPGLVHPTLDYLLDTEGNYPPRSYPSERDWTIANTVIQWLGTHVGMAFLSRVLNRHASNYQLVDFVERIVEERSDSLKKTLIKKLKESL